MVDDELMTRQMLTMLLGLGGFEAIEAENGLAALAQVAQHHPDAIILDVMMPGMDGITACKKLRANPATRAIPVIMLSGRAQLAAEEEGLAAGANVYLKKPMDPKELLDILKGLLAVETTSVRL
ncbi:MAG: response regulator [Chloroflexi bacterium]|nr:response regulator [Chloroflexota bacterium]